MTRQPSRADVVGLLRNGCWTSLPVDTIESLVDGGSVRTLTAGDTVYAEADAGGLAVVLDGLLRVYMHASDGRQVTVRCVRAGAIYAVWA